MAPIPSFVISSGSKKNEPRYVCMSESKASHTHTHTHTHKTWTEVSSSVLHFLQVGLLLSPIIYKCLLKVLHTVRRPITTLNCVLLKDNNQALVARSGPEINSQACLYALQGSHHNTRCWFSIQYFIFPLIFCLETPKKGSGPTNCWTEPSLASLLTFSLPRTPACSGTWYSPTVCRIEISFSIFLHCRTSVGCQHFFTVCTTADYIGSTEFSFSSLQVHLPCSFLYCVTFIFGDLSFNLLGPKFYI
jgi:hypothetical protein